MASGFIVTPTHNLSCKLDPPRQNWGFRSSSLGSLIVRRPLLKRVQPPSTYHLPPHPGLRRFSALATSFWNHHATVNEANDSSTYELSNGFWDLLKQRSESGLSNNAVELEGKNAEDWDDNDGDSFLRSRRDGRGNYDDRSSTDTEGGDWSWYAEERRDSRPRTPLNAEDSRLRGVRSKLTISKSHPSIAAKFSKYTRWKNPNREASRSRLVKQQMRDANLRNQSYYREKSVFFQDFTPPVVKPEHPCQFSYSEHPSVPPIGFREPVYSPFGPENMVRPWTGKRPSDRSKRAPREFDSFKLPPPAMTKARFVEPPGPFLEGTGPRLGRSREEILGEPLSKDEVRQLVEQAQAGVERRQLDLGKDGLTHNMLDLLHRHWKRRRVCRIKCYGVPTVDMDNLCRVIEEKSGGKIIRRSRSILYVFRGRNYNWNTRPKIPLMLWKPPAPIYSPVAQRAPEGLSVEEADNLRAFGGRFQPICRLRRAGMYQNLVKMVKDAFEVDELVKVDCRELEKSDMKKIGAKLRDLVPCVPLSFDRHFMMLWKGSKLQGESQNRGEGDFSGAETAPCGKIIISNEDRVEVCHETLQDEESEVCDLPRNCSNQEDEQVKDGHDDTDAEVTSFKGHRGAKSHPKSEDILLQDANVPETADFTGENEFASPSMNEDRVISSNANTRESVTVLEESEESVLEFDRLWQEAINCNEVLMLDESEADLDSVLEKVQKWDDTLKSWEENPSDGRGTSNLEFEDGCNGGLPLDSPRNGAVEILKEDEFPEANEDAEYEYEEDPLSMIKEDESPEADEEAEYEYEEDGEEPETEIHKAEEALQLSMTDITIPQNELERLRALRLTIKGWIMIGTQGISRGIVSSIHSKWLVSEIAKVRCVKSGCNMRKVHDDLERLTGGIVIWREGPAVVVYRGKEYVPLWMRNLKGKQEAYRKRLQSLDLEEESEKKERGTCINTQISKIGEKEIEELMDSLGPQYADWTGRHVPVDGDLLLSPNVEFKSPFRLLPNGMRPRLTNFEMTEMRHLARRLRPHFALGQRRGLEGLASAIVKLWEKSEIVKVVIKRGVSRTDNDRIAAELIRLTGGDLIARNMTYIALFRGNDFLSPAVKTALEEKDRMARAFLEGEERARLSGCRNATQVVDAPSKPSNAGTLAESLKEKARWDPWQNSKDHFIQIFLGREAARVQAFQRKQRILNCVALKINRAEKELQNINSNVMPKGMPVDKEPLSEEEMYTLRKIGLRMKKFLLLGRREVFGGIIENMHLHWKWRELVKIIVKSSYFMYRRKDEVEEIARMLETESGGVLVGICTIPVGEAIIVYRGKNYQRPSDGIGPGGQSHGLRPPGLLTKKQAWKRFNQKRRKRSLQKHLQKLEKDFNMIQADLGSGVDPETHTKLNKTKAEDVSLDNEEATQRA